MTNYEAYQEYWDNKFEYFKETEGWGHGREDVPRGDVVNKYISLLKIDDGEALLDIGCGHGRLFDIYKRNNANIYGIDISNKMISQAKINYSELTDNLSVMSIENLEFPDNKFDKIVCYAVFDGIYDQSIAIQEMSRVLKDNKTMMLSGKHKPYLSDDNDAKIAEDKAEQVNHPNVFSKWDELIKDFENNGLIIEHQLFFQRRGDMSKYKFVTSHIEEFYEFIVILRKL
jgi:ubiquinone/menaquinone biosynthesis C-methylase UbiE